MDGATDDDKGMVVSASSIVSNSVTDIARPPIIYLDTQSGSLRVAIGVVMESFDRDGISRRVSCSQSHGVRGFKRVGL